MLLRAPATSSSAAYDLYGYLRMAHCRSRSRARGTENSLTLRWRKTNSDFRFRTSREHFLYALEPGPASRPGSQSRILTTNNAKVIVRRARLAPAMISTPGHRISRRRQREAPPAWRDFLGKQPQAAIYQPRAMGCLAKRKTRALHATFAPLPQTAKGIDPWPSTSWLGTKSSHPSPSSGESATSPFQQLPGDRDNRAEPFADQLKQGVSSFRQSGDPAVDRESVVPPDP